jgi:hypothetical protein
MRKMTEALKQTRASSFGAFAALPMYPGAPRIAFAPENEGGTKTAEELAAETAAAEAAAATAAAEAEAAKNKTGKTAEELAAEEAAAAAAETNKDKGLLAEVMAKKNKIKELETNLAKFDGIDPDAVRALLAEKRTAELTAEEAKGNFARVKEMMVTEHDKATKTLQDTIADLTVKLSEKDGTINELTIGRSFSESKFIGEDLVLPRTKARAIYSSHFDVVDGKIVGFDKPAGAKERTQIVGTDGNPVPFEDAIKRIVDADPEKDSLYRDKSKPGANSSSKKIEAGKEVVQDKGLFGAARILAGLNAAK